ncbi:Uu.00g034220.m01.CDS01 [Anthostomella pinea]|uniref:Uu.00g034220.m01.CDS01 n=1 Tax=Anthostomella pinea TaxID=933095 RepID=A0AAI8V911_9PEZI|nr:Uu.00g034220.m01.CDS01 [Anthostomella pinea]
MILTNPALLHYKRMTGLQEYLRQRILDSRASSPSTASPSAPLAPASTLFIFEPAPVYMLGRSAATFDSTKTAEPWWTLVTSVMRKTSYLSRAQEAILTDELKIWSRRTKRDDDSESASTSPGPGARGARGKARQDSTATEFKAEADLTECEDRQLSTYYGPGQEVI